MLLAVPAPRIQARQQAWWEAARTHWEQLSPEEQRRTRRPRPPLRHRYVWGMLRQRATRQALRAAFEQRLGQPP